MKNKNELFERMPVPQAVLYLGLPTMAGMALTVLYGMADMIFVGMAGDAEQLAVIALLSPVTTVAMSVGAVFGIGGSSCLSRQLGAKQRREAARTGSFCFYSALFLGLLSTAAGLVLLPAVLQILGAGGSMAPLAVRCGRLLLIGTTPAVLSFTLNQLIRAAGNAGEAMNGMVLGALVNVAADPFFILFLDMGAEGSAAAALLTDLVSLIYYIRVIRRTETISLSLSDFRASRSTVKSIFAIGIPSAVTHFLVSISGVFFNRLCMRHGEHVVAAFSVARRVMMMPNMISLGLAKGAQPLIGYNYAAGNLRRMRRAVFFSCVFGTVICSFFSVFVFLRSGGLIQLFTNDPDVVWLGMVVLKAILFAMPIAAFDTVLLAAFQAMGEASTIFFLSVGKQALLYLPLMFLADRFLGLSGLILLEPLKEYLSAILSFLFYFFLMRRCGQGHTPLSSSSKRQRSLSAASR